MDAKDYEAKQHLFIWELNKIDNQMKPLIELTKKPNYDLYPSKADNDAKIAELQVKRKELSDKYTEFENSIYDFLMS